jgi:hypothetical protein
LSESSSDYCKCGEEHDIHEHCVTEENFENPGTRIIKKINSSGRTNKGSKSLKQENHM